MIDNAKAVRNSRWRRNASVVIGTMMVILFGYGLVRFPDGPLHMCVDHGYYGKQGQPHTQTEFEAFEIWQNALFWVWPIGMVVLYVLNRDRTRAERAKVASTESGELMFGGRTLICGPLQHSGARARYKLGWTSKPGIGSDTHQDCFGRANRCRSGCSRCGVESWLCLWRVSARRSDGGGWRYS
jgi:uncharacterized membrane protein